MDHTSLSLLQRAREGDDSRSWGLLAEIYTPLLKTWLLRYELQPSDIDDVVQETLLVVAREMSKFEHSGRAGAFRTWLKNILYHRLQNFWRTRRRHPQGAGDSGFLKTLNELNDPASEQSRAWDREHDQHVLRRLLEIVEPRFQASTREAFRRVVLEGQDAEKVADDLGMSLNAVMIAKSRVLKELRREGRGLFEE
jgi:RNA polymerase sigma-70 factor (ECF subfamily)